MWISVAAKRCVFQLFCTISSLAIAISSLISSYNTSDRVSNLFGAYLTSLGFVHFVSFTSFLHKLLLETSYGLRFVRKYKLSLPEILDITNKLVSVVQATFSCVAGVIVCRYSCTKNFLTASHYLSESYAWFGAAYFFYDIWGMYRVSAAQTAAKLKAKLMSTIATNGGVNGDCKVPNGAVAEKSFYDKYNEKAMFKGAGDSNDRAAELYELLDSEFPTCRNGTLSIFVSGRVGVPSFVKYIFTHPLMVLHHLFIGSYGLIVLTSRNRAMGDCIFTTIFLMELSTPFVSIRGILSIMNLKNARIYVINGLLMLITFFFCRIVLLPYVMYLYADAANKGYIEAAFGLPKACKWSIAIILLPQLYWFNLMVKGASKVFFPPKQKGGSINNNSELAGKMATKVD